MKQEKTIYALSSGMGKAGVAIIRISGEKSGLILRALIGQQTFPQPRQAVVRRLIDPRTKEWLDTALVLFFPKGNSFTGEESVELHLHGGKAVIDGVLASLSSFEETSYAQPGEFTRRAFYSGQMNLLDVEALCDVIEAQTQKQKQQALEQMSGGLSSFVESALKDLRRVLAHVESEIDFSQEDIPLNQHHIYKKTIQKWVDQMESLLNDGHGGEMIRQGSQIVLLGQPNSGKSSFLNQLAQRQVAIVSQEPGTTRDTIDLVFDLKGLAITFTDTAGLRESSHPVEKQGIERAVSASQGADFVFILLDGLKSCEIPQELKPHLKKNHIILINKIDHQGVKDRWLSDFKKDKNCFYISAKTGAGVDEVLNWLEEQIICHQTPHQHVITRHRHRTHIEACLQALERSLSLEEDELFAEELRFALHCLGNLAGYTDVEDLLDIIFKDFCIGK